MQSINHWVLHSLLIMILALEPFFSDSQVLEYYYLVLYTIFLENYYLYHYTPGWKLN